MGNVQGIESASVNLRPVVELDSARATRGLSASHHLAEQSLGVFYLPSAHAEAIVDEGLARIRVDQVGFTTYARLARLGMLSTADHVEALLTKRAQQGDHSAQLTEQANFYISQINRADVFRPRPLSDDAS